MQKWISFLLFLLVFNSCSLAQEISPSRAGKGEENTRSTTKDSTFQLIQTIPIQSTYLTTDNLQNLYIATEEGQIIKLDKNGKKQFDYNNNRLGKVGKIDVRNPLTILVYYPDFAIVVILDRTLSEIKELNLYDLAILEPKVVGLANDNNIWIYDEVTAILKKVSQEGKVLFESRNLNQLTQKQLSPVFLHESNNQLFLSDAENGLFIFDAFGQLKQTIPTQGIERFQVFGNQLFFQRNGKGFLLGLDTFEEENAILPVSSESAESVYVSPDFIYLRLRDAIEIYSPK